MRKLIFVAYRANSREVEGKLSSGGAVRNRRSLPEVRVVRILENTHLLTVPSHFVFAVSSCLQLTPEMKMAFIHRDGRWCNENDFDVRYQWAEA